MLESHVFSLTSIKRNKEVTQTHTTKVHYIRMDTTHCSRYLARTNTNVYTARYPKLWRHSTWCCDGSLSIGGCNWTGGAHYL